MAEAENVVIKMTEPDYQNLYFDPRTPKAQLEALKKEAQNMQQMIDQLNILKEVKNEFDKEKNIYARMDLSNELASLVRRLDHYLKYAKD